VLEEAPEVSPAVPEEGVDSPELLLITAPTARALTAMLNAYVNALGETNGSSAKKIAFTTALRRTHYAHRIAIAGTLSTWREVLREHLAGQAGHGLSHGVVDETRRRVVFVFSPHGSQWFGMGRDLYEQEPVFRETLAAFDDNMRGHAGWSIVDRIVREPSSAWLDQIAYLHPTMVAMQVSLAALFRSWGIEPDAVIGHSVGEISAACVAGKLSLADAARVISLRSRLLGAVEGRKNGAMGIVELSLSETCRMVEPYGGAITVGASNGPRFTVISGEKDAIQRLFAELASRKIFHGWGIASVASHSFAMAKERAVLEASLSDLHSMAGDIPFHSTVATDPDGGNVLDADYWGRHLVQPVLFWPALSQLIRSGHDLFVEMGPHPVLTSSIEDGLRAHGRAGRSLGSLRRQEAGRRAILDTVGALFVEGVSIDWSNIFRKREHPVGLPTYIWQRERHWLENASTSKQRASPKAHPHLAKRIECAATPEVLAWELDLTGPSSNYIADHRVRGRVIIPGATYLEAVFCAAKQALAVFAVMLRDVTFHEVLFRDDDETVEVQLVTEPVGDGLYFRVFARRTRAASWTLHASGHARPDDGTYLPITPAEYARAPSAERRSINARAHYARLRRSGVVMGASFCGVEEITAIGADIMLDVALPSAATEKGFLIHPVWIDLCFQALAAAAPLDDSLDEVLPTYLPVSVNAIRMGTSIPERRAQVHAVVRARELSDEIEADMTLVHDGKTTLFIEGVKARRIDVEHSDRDLGPWLCQLSWHHQALELRHRTETKFNRAEHWLILGDPEGLGQRIAAVLVAKGANAEVWNEPREVEGPSAIADWLRDRTRPTVVLHLRSFQVAATDLDLAQTLLLDSLLHVVQGLSQSEIPAHPRIWVATRHAVAVEESDRIAPTAAAIWGFVRTIALELPEFRISRLDLAKMEGEEVAAIVDEIGSAAHEDQVARRGSFRFVARLEAGSYEINRKLFSMSGRERAIWTPSSDGTYLLVGGTGGVGFEVAEWMVRQGARHLVLMGRHSPREDQAGKIATWIREGTQVVVALGDVARRDDVERVLENIRRSRRPLRGIINSSVVLEDGILLRLESSRLKPVMDVKARGSLNLHELSLNDPLEFFVLFSSAGSMIGAPGQGSYSAASAFQDALAHLRHFMGLPGLSISWGPWAHVGRAADTAEKFHARGFESMDPIDGLRLLPLLLQSHLAHIGAFRLDVRRWRPFFPQAAEAAFLRDLMKSANGHEQGLGNGALRKELDAIADDRTRRTHLERHLCRRIADVMRSSPNINIDPQRPFGSMGLDSLMALEVRNRLEMDLDMVLPATTLFDRPTVAGLAEHLLIVSGFSMAGNAAAAPRLSDAETAALVNLISLVKDNSKLDGDVP
jgi:myxalamid-type polyketide synthase MxaE and MxaD